VALLLAYVADPLLIYVRRRWHVPRWLTATLLAVASIAALIAILLWLEPIATEQLHTLIQRLPDYARALSSRFGLVHSGEVAFLDTWIDRIVSQLKAAPQQTLSGIVHTTTTALGIVRHLMSVAGRTALVLFVVPLLFVGFAWRFDRMVRWARDLVPLSRRARVAGLARKMDRVVAGFFRGRIVISFFVGALLATGWSLTGVPYWALLGALSGVLNIVPYLSTVCWPAAVALRYAEAVTSGQGVDAVQVVVLPSVVFFAGHALENWVLTPWIQSESTELSVVSVTIAMLVGGAAGGILGLVLAIPVAACGKILIEEAVLPRWRRWAEEH
jgi:predicted PurR-regulated permease PerM